MCCWIAATQESTEPIANFDSGTLARVKKINIAHQVFVFVFPFYNFYGGILMIGLRVFNKNQAYEESLSQPDTPHGPSMKDPTLRKWSWTDWDTDLPLILIAVSYHEELYHEPQ